MTPSHRRTPQLGRRELLRGGMGLASAALAAPLLSACTGGGSTGSAPDKDAYPRATPDQPVELPIFESNPPIESGLSPENAKVLKVLNYADYIAPEVMKSFKKKYGATVQVTVYSDFEELKRRMLEPGADFDVVYAGPTLMSRLVYYKQGLFQPFNRDYLPNIANLWPAFQDPFYDQGAQYSVPYMVYTTGIAYRKDRVAEVPENGWRMLWDKAHAGKVGIHNDGGSALVTAMLAWDITDDINSDRPADIDAAKEKLIELKALGVQVSSTETTDIPSGKLTVAEAWSGGMTWMEDDLDGGATVDDLGYWVPADRTERIIGNETISIFRAAQSPVLAHAFINHMLDEQEASANTYWNGYQQPLSVLTPDYIIGEELWSPFTRPFIAVEDDYVQGKKYLESTVATEQLYLRAWKEFLSAT